MKILIADDDPTTRFLVEDSLIEWGYDVVLASDGDQALNALHVEDPPRIAVLDWLMPGMDGISVCKHVKEDQGIGKHAQGEKKTDTPFIYIILLTRKTETKDVVEGLNAGADDFLKKPVDLAELKSRLAVGARTINYEKMLLESEKRVRIECYNALSALAETRDNETGMHLKRISIYCRILSERLGMEKHFVQEIELFSPMHDIGKVGIPDYILLAPRKLTQEEFEIMKTHSTLGFQILENRKTFEMGADIAHYHHEKFDGSGYPCGLKGEDIPMSARIVAIADAYDALCSERHYKKAWTREDTINEIRSIKGSHFDPDVIDAFLKEEESFAMVWDAYVDE